jgi:hypothetical protein
MNLRSFVWGLSLSAACAAFVAAPCLAQEQGPTPKPVNPATAAMAAAMAKPTPMAAEGHPDLNGLWGSGFDLPIQKKGDSVFIIVPVVGVADAPPPSVDQNQVKLAELMDVLNNERRAKDPNKPPYKPEFLAKVQQLSENENKVDPTFFCHQEGVPRIGPPKQIVQTPGQVVFLYETQEGNPYRVIPTDGRPHRADLDPSYYGDGVGHWEGSTLVVDTVNFNDDTWLGIDGYFHSAQMHVIEKFTRQGDALHYEVTVDDPGVFTRPWIMNPRLLRITPDDPIEEEPRCVELDESHIVSTLHH